jgi:hypothetical protein
MDEAWPAIKNTPLRDVILPGTHDSATSHIDGSTVMAPGTCADDAVSTAYFWGRDVGRKMIADWSRAQDTTVWDQLNGGIRYLDIRIARMPASDYSDSLFTYHGAGSTSAFQVVDDIATFANLPAHRHELVIVDLSHWCEMTAAWHRKFVNHLETKLRNRLIPRTGSSVHDSLEQLTRRGNVLVIYGDDDDIYTADHSRFWSRSDIWSPYKSGGASSAAQLKKELAPYLDQREQHADQLFVLQGQVTPDGSVIGKGVFEGTTLLDIAKETTPQVVDWVSNDWATRHLNIVMVDGWQYGDLVNKVKALNLRGHGDNLMLGFLAPDGTPMVMGSPNGTDFVQYGYRSRSDESTDAPGVAQHGDCVFMAWSTAASEPKLASNCTGAYAPRAWVNAGRVGSGEAASSPSLISSGGCLIAAWRTPRNHVAVSRNCSQPFTSTAWELTWNIPRATSTDRPALAFFNDCLFVAFRATNNTLNLVRNCDTRLAPTEWQAPQSLGMTLTAPSIAAYGRLFLVASVDTSHHLRVAYSADARSFQVKVFAPEIVIGAPSIAAYTDHVALAWTRQTKVGPFALPKYGEMMIATSSNGVRFADAHVVTHGFTSMGPILASPR